MDHGIIVPGGGEAVSACVWNIATRREQWPFVALYTSRRAEGHKGPWFEENVWGSSYVPTGTPLSVTPFPDNPDYCEEYGRYEPEHEVQFLKMCQSVREITLVVPSTCTNKQALGLLCLAYSLQPDIEERFFKLRRIGDLFRSFRPNDGWVCIFFCFDSIPVTTFLSNDRADIDALLEASDSYRFEKW